MARFDPRPLPEGVDNGYARFEQAVGPFTMAVQIASALSGYWCPTDEWDFKFTVGPSSTPSARPGPGPSPLSLSSAIAAAGANNAALHTATGSQSTSSTRPQDDVNLRMLGQPPPPRAIAHTVTQLRYQGLWWGAERIWTDELVRLKPSRQQLAPEGTEDIFPPSGPSKKTLADHLASQDPDPTADLTAGGRGVFMRLEGLFVVDAVNEDGSGTRKECRACGMLYELADEDWEEDPSKSGAVSDEVKSGALSSTNEMNRTTSHMNGPTSQGSSFLPEPSPNPALLRQLNPAVPLTVTASSTLTRGLRSDASESCSPNVQLSHPILSVPNELPTPPRGFKFRPILAPGCEAVVSLSLIAGRYYPLLLAHPLLAPSVAKVLSNTLEEGGLLHEHHLWSLEGLTPGFFNSVDPVKVRPSRVAMLRDADKVARSLLEQVREERIFMKAEEMETERPFDIEETFRQMDVDGS
jgi:Transcription-silencing protein Clr2